MFLQDFAFVPLLNESLSRVAYHYTNLSSAAKIMKAGEFQLSSVVGSVEEQYAPKGYPYFLSATRTRRGGYHDQIGRGAAMFVLDGDWFNQRYKAGPVDYWQNRNPEQTHHRAHEAEDRIFSKEPTIPLGGVSAVHVYVEPLEADERAKWAVNVPAWARQVLLAAKKQGIAAYLYEDLSAWRNLDTRKTVEIKDRESLRGPEFTTVGGRRHKGYLLPWIELMNATKINQLSDKAKSLRYSLAYDYDKNSAVSGLANDLSNARKPNSGPDRESAIKIITQMKKLGTTKVQDFVEHLAKKWKEITEREQGEVNEAAYSGNIGAMEMMKFYQVATDKQKRVLKDLIAHKKNHLAWELIQKVVGVRLFKNDLVTESTTAQEVADYAERTHNNFRDTSYVMSFPEWELSEIPVNNLIVANPQDGDIDVDHVKRITLQDIAEKPIIVDQAGAIIDGNHRAVAAVLLGLDKIPAYRPLDAD